jgi:hypothetical protein
MSPWIDPEETDPATWTGEPETPSGSATVYERAHGTTIPYERRDDLTVWGPDVAAEFRTAAFDHARLHYHVAVDSKGRVKLLSTGHLWGHEETHRRFRIQYRRAAEPTDVPPFTEYTAWTRFETGTVGNDGDGLQFEPDPDRTEERTLTLSWPAMYSSDQLRLAEAELVRNPPLARHVLRERELYDDVRYALRYNPEAFDRGP